MTKKIKIENIKNQGGKTKGKDERKSVFGLCFFQLLFCDPRKPSGVISGVCGLCTILYTNLEFK